MKSFTGDHSGTGCVVYSEEEKNNYKQSMTQSKLSQAETAQIDKIQDLQHFIFL